MAIGSGGGVPSTKGLPVVKGFGSFTPTQAPPVPFFQSDDSNSYSIINAGRVAVAAVVIASGGLFMPPAAPVATSAQIGVPIQAGGSPARVNRVYYQTRSEPPALATVVVATTVEGWQAPLSLAPPVAQAATVSYDLPSVPAANPVWWQQTLSIPIPAALVRQGFASVPFNTAQLSVNFTPVGWQAQPSVAPLSNSRQADTDYSLPLYTAPVADNNVTLDKWQPALSVAPPIAKAQAGFASVPYNTAQAAAPTPPSEIGIPLHSGGTSRIRRVYAQTRFEPPYVAPVVVAAYTDLYLQPLSTPPPVAKAQAGFSSVPFNTAQLSVNFTPFGWHQALSTPPTITRAAAYFGSVPLNTAQLSVNFTDLSWAQPLAGAPPVASAQPPDWSLPYSVVNVVSTSWQSALSVAPDVARTQPDFGQLPAYPLQASPVGIAGMAWFTPLWTVPTRNLVAQPGNPSVPFNTTQQIVVTTPGRRRPILFIANVGRLMN